MTTHVSRTKRIDNIGFIFINDRSKHTKQVKMPTLMYLLDGADNHSKQDGSSRVD